MLKAVLFDMDGVLIDSVEISLRVRKKILKQYGIDLDNVPDPEGEGHRASSLKSLLMCVEDYSGLNIDHDEFAQLSKGYNYEEFHKRGVSADPELILLLEELTQRGVVCAVASSGIREGVQAKLEMLDIERYFSVIVTGSDVQEHKPNPEVYIRAMDKLAMQPSECIIFEDSVTGIRAGRSAGCHVIGFAQYSPSIELLPGTTVTINSWGEMDCDRLNRLMSVN